jgi:hypothetical protein
MSFSHCAVIAEGLHPRLANGFVQKWATQTPIRDPSVSMKIVYRPFVSEIFPMILAEGLRWEKQPEPVGLSPWARGNASCNARARRWVLRLHSCRALSPSRKSNLTLTDNSEQNN